MEKIKKYYPFWLGLFITICFIGIGAKHDCMSFAVLGAFILGYFRLTNFHKD